MRKGRYTQKSTLPELHRFLIYTAKPLLAVDKNKIYEIGKVYQKSQRTSRDDPKTDMHLTLPIAIGTGGHWFKPSWAHNGNQTLTHAFV